MLRPIVAAGSVLALLAACQAEGGPDGGGEPGATEPADAASEVAAASTPAPSPASASPAPADTEADDSDCGADKLGRWLNVLPTEPIKAAIAEAVGERPIRYYTQGDPITMDFSPARLNVELGVDGRIKVFRCG
jgi:hypothetical protein